MIELAKDGSLFLQICWSALECSGFALKGVAAKRCAVTGTQSVRLHSLPPYAAQDVAACQGLLATAGAKMPSHIFAVLGAKSNLETEEKRTKVLQIVLQGD